MRGPAEPSLSTGSSEPPSAPISRSTLTTALTARVRTVLAELDRAIPEIRHLAHQLEATVPAEERASAEAAEGELPYPLSLAGAVDCLTRESAPAVYTDLWELATACDAEPYGRTLDPEALWRR
ncbi:MAG TPA: hypothetical protein VF017_11055, partial [Thermoanaerobaculia bacterium]|nr:hypothetical protein [Thermoanaerobaculia bacterium]